LQPDGFLVLGKSESTSNLADYFEPFLNRDKIYRKKNTAPNIATNLFEPATFISRIKADQTGGAAMQKKSRLETVIEKEVLDRYGPVGVVVDENMEVVQVRGRTGEFLSLASGKPSLNLLKMIREELSLDMFHALQQAKTTKAFVRTPQIPVGSGGDTVSIEVVPITGDNDAESYLLVFFDKAGRARANTAEAAGPEEPVTADWRRQQEELAATQEYMKSVIFQYETNSEQLRTANEEVQSSNEELQTMNEELETAKEELQSTNEELVTLNEELQSRNEDLRNANSDIQNVLRSIGTSILMLDGDLRIRRFNPGAEWLFNLIQTDLGRPISNLRYNLHLADFEKKIKKAIGDIVLVEEEVVADSGEWYLMQIRPYRTIDNQIDGAVILFTDITSMRRNLDASRSALVLTERIVETMPDPLVILQPDLRIKSANKAFYETVKASAADTLNKYIYDLDNGLWNSPALRELLNDLAAKTAAARDASLGWESPDLGRRTVAVNARRTIEEGPANDFIVVLARDITSGK
jgi:two-component system CheB/CheR fusion protein